MSDDLIDRARAAIKHAKRLGVPSPLLSDMADEIARLRAEVERLKEAERTAWERGRDAAADECDRLRASYGRSAKGYDEDDPLRGLIKYSGAAVAVASAYIRDLQPPEPFTPEAKPWEPPPAGERPFNFECLGWVYGGWDFVFWNDTHWVTRKGNPCTPGHFRPMPPAPKQEPH